MRTIVAAFLTTISLSLNAQDSALVALPERINPDAPKEKRFTHDLGFNTILLIKQVFSNNPSAQLTQLPYQVGYTLGFGNDLGLRLGVGFNQSVTETDIQGLTEPRKTSVFSGSYRLGINKNFVDYKKIVCNAFFDFTIEHANTNTETVSDISSPPGAFVQSQKFSAKSTSPGAQVGIGVKYCFNKHIALGTEVPVAFKYSMSEETDKTVTTQFGVETNSEEVISSSTTMTTKIILPTTLFLIIMF